MGSGTWTAQAYDTYRATTCVKDINNLAYASLTDIYTNRSIDSKLAPSANMCRECCDSEEHPNTKPVIIALDVTGSMGRATQTVAAKLSEIMKELYQKIPDVEFMFMGIGDLECDRSPVQLTQFESDVRIAEQLEKVYFESGGGGNGYESYTAAWYMASRHTKLDCWERGQKGLIITLGDEPLNPTLHKEDIKRHIGDNVAEDIHTKTLYDEVNEKYGVYHFSVDDSDTCYFNYKRRISDTWDRLLGDHSKVVTIDNLKNEIVTLIENFFSEDNVMDYAPITTEKVNNSTGLNLDEDGLVSW